MKFQFTKKAQKQFLYWEKHDPKIQKKVISLLKDIQASPFAGLGKPEALKYELQGYWSRRITGEHRLVYRIEEHSDYLVCTIFQCRFHYDL